MSQPLQRLKLRNPEGGSIFEASFPANPRIGQRWRVPVERVLSTTISPLQFYEFEYLSSGWRCIRVN